MLSKNKFPNLNRAQRRNPGRLVRSLTQVSGGAPSLLLQRLLILNGYWPENDLDKKYVAPATEVARVEAASKGVGVVSRAWGKVKGWFGRK